MHILDFVKDFVNQRANYNVYVWRHDNKEWIFYWEHPFPRALGYKRRSDIKEIDNTKFRVCRCARELGLGKLQLVIEP